MLRLKESLLICESVRGIRIPVKFFLVKNIIVDALLPVRDHLDRHLVTKTKLGGLLTSLSTRSNVHLCSFHRHSAYNASLVLEAYELSVQGIVVVFPKEGGVKGFEQAVGGLVGRRKSVRNDMLTQWKKKIRCLFRSDRLTFVVVEQFVGMEYPCIA